MNNPLLIIALYSLVAHAYEKNLDPTKLMNSVPERIVRLEKKGRMPASVEAVEQDRKTENAELEKKLKVGTYAIIKDSVEEWNNQVVQVTSRYEDGSRQVKMDNGSYARVKYDNLITLSPETDKCCKSNGVDICRGDKVWHPLPTTSLGVPEGKVLRIFENCSTVIRDGLDYIYQMKQVGKSVDCSPMKESVCVGKIVYVEGYRNGKRYQFEGPVEKVFTNGSALVKTGLWLLPVDAASAIVQTDTLHARGNRSPASAVITHRDGQQAIPVPNYPEIEPFDANDAQKLIDRRGITYPIR